MMASASACTWLGNLLSPVSPSCYSSQFQKPGDVSLLQDDVKHFRLRTCFRPLQHKLQPMSSGIACALHLQQSHA